MFMVKTYRDSNNGKCKASQKTNSMCDPQRLFCTEGLEATSVLIIHILLTSYTELLSLSIGTPLVLITPEVDPI